MADHELVSTQLPDHDVSGVLSALADVIESRKGSDPQKSYVAKLFSKAPDGVLKKIGEEAVECVMAAKDENKRTSFTKRQTCGFTPSSCFRSTACVRSTCSRSLSAAKA